MGFDKGIVSFNQTVLNKYESATGNKAYRIMIPRALYAMYCIRNKRGVSHISSISPNKMDASFILSSTKWVLAELVRIAGATSPDEAQKMVDVVIDKQVDLVWDDGETFIILNKKLKHRRKYSQHFIKMIELKLKFLDVVSNTRTSQISLRSCAN